jgi:hypothetical protein
MRITLQLKRFPAGEGPAEDMMNSETKYPLSPVIKSPAAGGIYIFFVTVCSDRPTRTSGPGWA